MKTKFKISNRILSLVLAFVMVLSMMPMSSFTAFAAEGEACVSTTDCTGTYANGICSACDGYQPAVDSDYDSYYEISNAGQLYWFAAVVNGGYGYVGQNLGANAILTENITVNENVLKADGTLNGDGTSFRVWTPIGTDTNRYIGTFDGNNKTVSGLYFNDSATSYVGLFSSLSSVGTVKNVGVVDSYLNGNECVGGVVGYNGGTVNNCYNSGTVSGSSQVGGVVGYLNNGTVQSCYNTGAVSGSDEVGNHVGGVVGSNDYGTVRNCYNTGTVSGYDYVGGVVGSNDYGTVQNCYNSGSVSGSSQVGGVVGYMDSGTVQNCYNSGSVSGIIDVGGVVGRNGGTVTNCYYLSGTAAGGIDGSDVTGSAEAKTAVQFASGEVAYLLNGDQSAIVFMQTLGTDDYPSFTGAKVYYGYNSCTETATKIYTNDSTVSAERPAHKMDATTGKCVCGLDMADASLTTAGETPVVTYYATLEEAITAAQTATGSTVKLLDSVTISDCIYIEAGQFTIDLNGKTLTSTDDAFRVKGANVTVTSGVTGGKIEAALTSVYVTTGGTAKVTGVTLHSNRDYAACARDDENAVLTLENVTITSGNSGVFAAYGGKVEILGTSSVKANQYDIDCDFDSVLTVGAGVTFPDGLIALSGTQQKPLKDMLADGMAYWTGENQMVQPDANTYEITGTVTVREACTHSDASKFTYTADGDTITATCASCNSTAGNATITVVSTDLTYDGTKKELTVESTIPGVEEPEITCATDLMSAGTHKASITLGSATATLDVTIEKATPTVTAPTGLTAIYGQTLDDVGLPAGFTWQDAETTSVGNAGSNTFRVIYTPDETENYKTVSDIEVTIQVEKATPEYTVPTGLTVYVGQTLNDIDLPSGWTWHPDEDSDFVFTSFFAGNHSAFAIYTPEDTENYKTINYVAIFTVLLLPIDGATVTVSGTHTYNGSAITPEVTVTLGEKTLTKDTDYTVSYSDNVNAGTATVTITGKGDYTGKASATFTIAKATPAVTTKPAAVENLEYTGTAQALVTEGTASGGTMQYKVDDGEWSTELPKATNAGTYTVYYKVIGNENYKDVDPVSFTVTIVDKTDPTGEIKIKENGWDKFWNWISFGLFCKDYVDVTVTADGTGSGVVKVEYLFSSEALEEKNMPTDGWTEVSENDGKYKFSIQPQNKGAVYVRITDEGGNVTVINSDGIVVYKDSEAVDTEVTYTYKENSNKDIAVKFNGNTVKSIACGEKVLVASTDYSVDYKSGKIVLNASYLDTLSAGEYTFTVSYNPLGMEYTEATENDVPATTTFKVTVEQADGAVTNISAQGKTYDGKAVAEPTYTSLSTGKATFEYKLKGADDSTYTQTAPSSAGTYIVRVTVAADTNYKEASDTAEFTIDRAKLTNVSVKQNGTLTYNGEALTPIVSTNAVAVNNQPVTFTYSTLQDGTYGALPSFDKAGSYTVYYKATAPNHNEVTDYFTVTVAKAIVTEPTIASKPYTGTEQKADISDTDLYTVVQNNGGTEKGSYDVVLKLKDSANYKWSTTDNEEVTLQFVISAAQNDWDTKPSISGWTYGETAKAPVGAAKYGTVKVVYSGKANDGTDYNSETAPTKAGSYTATFTVEGTEDYSGLSEQVNFTIARATYDMTGAKWDYSVFDYDGLEKSVSVIGLPSGVTVSGYEGNKATVVGNYTAKVTFTYESNNYNTPVLSDLAWSIKNDWTPTEYVVSTPNANGWLNDEFTIIPAEGYVISTTNTADGGWEDKLTYTAESDNGSVTFYLKNTTNGTISLGKTVTYKIDKTPATGKVEFVDRTGWEEFLNTISFGLFYKDEVTVKITANDTLSGIANIEYYEADEVLTLDEVKAIKNWTTYNDSFGVSVEDTKKFVYFVRITDNAGNVTYLSTDGAEYDTTAPVISGVENGKTYYTTYEVAVTDKNIESITLNGETVEANITLDGNKNATYTIVATDKAGNSTTVTVTMKPISDLSAPIDNLNKDNVNSSSEQTVDEVKAAVAAVDTTNATEAEKEALKAIADKAAELEKVIDDTKAEIARINEELNKYNGATVNSDNAAALEQLAKDIKALTDGGNLTDAERTALTEDAGDVTAMQKTVTDTTAENNRISDAVDGYDLATVTSESKADLEQLLADIGKQLESTNLTDEEISELNGEKKAVEDLLTKIKGTDELIDKLTGDTDGYSEDTVKSTDKAAIEQIIEDIEALLETENLTEAEEKALEDAKAKAEGLLATIEDAAGATETENTDKVKDVTTENVTPENKTDLENAKADLEKALEDNGGNYTEDEKKAIEDEIKKIDEALAVVANVEDAEGKINALPDTITKDDTDDVDAAKKAYDGLSDYEKTLVDPEAKKKLEAAIKAAEEANKPADTTSPETGDNSNIPGLFALMLGSLAAMFAIIFGTKKKKKAEDR